MSLVRPETQGESFGDGCTPFVVPLEFGIVVATLFEVHVGDGLRGEALSCTVVVLCRVIVGLGIVPGCLGCAFWTGTPCDA